jgi:putative membrane protein
MIILETILHRWYAFGFVIAFFWSASAERGWKPSLRFWGVASLVSWVAEYLSTRTPFPYGRYDYQAGLDEAHFGNVPLFVPLSFCVVVWAGRALAQARFGARPPGRLILTGALCATALDLVIDPMTLLGRAWFLGPLYQFHATSGWFHVPWSNFLGWFLVSAVILWIDELLEQARGAPRAIDPIRGPTLAAVICVFFIAIAAATRNWSILVGQLIVVAALALACGGRIAELVRRAERTDEGPA